MLQNGMVLVAGGFNGLGHFPASTELYDTGRVGPGLPQATSTLRGVVTRRRCYKTAWSLLQGEMIALAEVLRAPNCTIR